MALRDTACYTLTLNPNASDPNVIELYEVGPNGKGQARYARVRETKDSEVYSGVVYDAFSGAKLASMGYENLKDKKRRLELHGPDESVSFEFTGKINFEWTFIFEGNKFRWSRELYGKDYICCLDRKPDPKVEICLAREADKKEPARLQILHYNLDRFTDEIKDLRGLETLLVASLTMIIDASEERSLRPVSTTTRPHSSPSSGAIESDVAAPPLPEKPKVISEEDYEPENPNEIVVGLNTNLDEHVARSIAILEDPQTLFIVIRTRNPAAAQRALEVSLGVTRFRHREVMGDLHQYVIEEDLFKPPKPEQKHKPGPQVINLDDPAPTPRAPSPRKGSTGWTAPNIAIYLSKIELPDLLPGRRETVKAKQCGQRIPSGSSTSPATSSPMPPQSAKLQRPTKTSPSPSTAVKSARPSQPGPPAPPPPARPMPGSHVSNDPSGPSSIPSQTAQSDQPAKSSSSGVSLTRLFKAAASKV